MAWTSLHAALGETDTELTFEMVEHACERRVSERADLDWKRELPLTAPRENPEQRRHQQTELAKDIAAMANSGGGVIVYGVAEASGASEADHVEAVGPVSDETMRNIRRVASGGQIFPPVMALELTHLAPEAEPDAGVLVMVVPDSSDRPHLIHPPRGQGWFACPYRHGPDTEWMDERQLAHAYAERESGRRRRLADFDERFDAFCSVLDQATDLRWVVAMAVPDTPLPRPRDLTLSRANTIIEAAWQWPWVGQAAAAMSLTRQVDTRRGLQRFVRSAQRTLRGPMQPTLQGRIEVHGDGTVAMAFTRDGALTEDDVQRTQVPIDDIERTALEFFALLWEARTRLGVSGDYTARLTVQPPTEIFRRPDPSVSGHYQPWDQTRVHGYRPIDGPVLTSDGLETALDTWADVVGDAVNQAGARSSLDVGLLMAEVILAD